MRTQLLRFYERTFGRRVTRKRNRSSGVRWQIDGGEVVFGSTLELCNHILKCFEELASLSTEASAHAALNEAKRMLGSNYDCEGNRP